MKIHETEMRLSKVCSAIEKLPAIRIGSSLQHSGSKPWNMTQ
ncbi:MAG: hypothetical protein PHQ23_04035 [Candidatus Wallbacteria bacterium]|nr:hypothetical protein [Candidatus Wallbacteria bacterium]